MTYTAPIREIRFVMEEIAGLGEIASVPGNEELSADLVDAIVDQAGKFAAEVLAPINRTGDVQGVRFEDGQVRTADGWRDAYERLCADGWNAVSTTKEYGGQGLPHLVAHALWEMMKSANNAFCGAFTLTNGAIEALRAHASGTLKEVFLPNMVSGKWTGTMNLTEPQAGSDLSAIRTRAERQGDGTYRIFGQKIFITYGEHDLSENIVHLVLARLPDAPAGVKGISLFVVPKYLVNEDGTLGERNDVFCISVEHKLGIRASPTCTMVYGDHGGALGYLVGEENQGLAYMFVMMNDARLSVGGEGIALAERAYQKALAFAKERTQGRDALTGENRVPILRHPDVRRMLLTMKTKTEACRALSYVVAAMIDLSRRHPDETVRKANGALLDLLTPAVKAGGSETAIEVASLGIQIHGGMGFIEETGAAQYLRDARITTIYEGTTGIQANDLVMRKVLRERGATIKQLIATIGGVAESLSCHKTGELNPLGRQLAASVMALDRAVDWILAEGRPMGAILSGTVPFLNLFINVCGGWMMGRAALAAARLLERGEGDRRFLEAKLLTAQFYGEHVLCMAKTQADIACSAAPAVMAMAEDQF